MRRDIRFAYIYIYFRGKPARHSGLHNYVIKHAAVVFCRFSYIPAAARSAHATALRSCAPRKIIIYTRERVCVRIVASPVSHRFPIAAHLCDDHDDDDDDCPEIFIVSAIILADAWENAWKFSDLYFNCNLLLLLIYQS